MDAVSALRRLKRAAANARAAERQALDAVAHVIHEGHVNDDPEARAFCGAVAEYIEAEQFLAVMYRRLSKMCRARRFAPHVEVLRPGVGDGAQSARGNGGVDVEEEEDPDWYPPPFVNAAPRSTASPALAD